MELLSPAGTLEAGIAAFEYGADAVYLGMKSFSARADAGNFDLSDLETLLGIARRDAEHPRKVYVAVNTLVKEDELNSLCELLAHLEAVGVDAVIVQDFAVARLCREYFPGLPVHGSTQMAVHNAEGVRQAQRMGCTRVVAAREVTAQELAVMAQVPGMEIEAFLHGALCYSYSGLCLMSALMHGSSGNRGDCSYVCRNKFTFGDMENPPEACCPMSMKDLAAAPLVSALGKAGVVSLKIEGRKKTPLYVAAVTNYYRKLLDHSFEPGEEKQCENDVRTIFSRPWTKLYLQSVFNKDVTDKETTGPRGVGCGLVARIMKRNDGDYLRFTVQHPVETHDGLQIELPGKTKPYGFGISELRQFPQNGGDRWERVFRVEAGRSVEIPLPDGHPDIPAGCKISHSSSQEVKRKYNWPQPRQGVNRVCRSVAFDVIIEKESLIAKACGCNATLSVEGGFSKAEHPERVEDSVSRAFGRLGGSGYTASSITVTNNEGYFVPSSMLNELRRQLVEKLDASESKRLESKISSVCSEIADYAVSLQKAELLSVKLHDAEIPDELLSAHSEIGEFVLPLNHVDDLAGLAEIPGVRWSLPVICRSGDIGRIKGVVAEALKLGCRRFEVGNLGAIEILRSADGNLEELDVSADWPLYVCNHVAAEELVAMGVSRVTACPEDAVDEQLYLAEKLKGVYRAVLWQEPLVGRSATCLMASARGFCPGHRACSFSQCRLTNSRGESLIAVNEHCQTNLLLSEALDLRHARKQFLAAGVTEFRFDFSGRQHKTSEMISVLEAD